MTNIITYGTFDLFHFGHYALLCKAKRLGDKLYVGVSTDEFNSLKGKRANDDYITRYGNVLDNKFVDYVFPENTWEQKIDDIYKYKIDIFVMGDDWKGKFDYLPCKVVYLPRTKGISSTMLREKLK